MLLSHESPFRPKVIGIIHSSPLEFGLCDITPATPITRGACSHEPISAPRPGQSYNPRRDDPRRPAAYRVLAGRIERWLTPAAPMG